MSDEVVLDFDAVAHIAGGVRTLDNVSLALRGGERMAIIGANGSGKSVLARLAAGLISPSSGHVRVFGDDPALVSQAQMRRTRGRIGLVLQGGSLMGELSVEDNLRLGLRAGGRPRDPRLRARLDRALVNFGLAHAHRRLASELSAGERRRVELARAFLREPDLLILDDPFEGADRDAAGDMMEKVEKALRRRAATLLLITHNELTARRFADQVSRLDRGRLEHFPT